MDYRNLITRKAIAPMADESLLEAEDTAPTGEGDVDDEYDDDIESVGSFRDLLVRRAAIMAIVEDNKVIIDPVKEKEARINKLSMEDGAGEDHTHEPKSYDGGVLNVEEV